MSQASLPLGPLFPNVSLHVTDADQLGIRQLLLHLLKGAEKILVPLAQADGAHDDETGFYRNGLPFFEDA